MPEPIAPDTHASRSPTEQIVIDLDDGVKVNYQKFGPALKKILGLDTKEE